MCGVTADVTDGSWGSFVFIACRVHFKVHCWYCLNSDCSIFITFVRKTKAVGIATVVLVAAQEKFIQTVYDMNRLTRPVDRVLLQLASTTTTTRYSILSYQNMRMTQNAPGGLLRQRCNTGTYNICITDTAHGDGTPLPPPPPTIALSRCFTVLPWSNSCRFSFQLPCNCSSTL